MFFFLPLYCKESIYMNRPVPELECQSVLENARYISVFYATIYFNVRQTEISSIYLSAISEQVSVSN